MRKLNIKNESYEIPSPAFQLISTVDEELICGLCNLALMNPVVTGCCRQTYCKNCISNRKECQNCKGNVVPCADPPKLVTNLLSRIEVKCVDCGKVMKRDDFKSHIETVCEIQCPWGCEATMLRSKVESHVPDCTKQILTCPAADVGCKDKFPRSELEAHLATCSFSLTRPMLNRLVALEKSLSTLEATIKKNENALAILCESVNLSHRDLSGKDLSDLNFIGADFTNADLSKTILINTNLTKCNLSKANLSDANLTNANLTRANLSGTNLTNAKLTKATLQCIEGCKQPFKFGETKYHPGRFKFMSEWSCCDKTDFTAPGCQNCNHKIQ